MNIELLRYLRSKIAIILGVSVIVSALFVIEKNFFTEYQIQHGTYASEIVLKVDMPNNNYYDKSLNYEILATSSTMVNKFFEVNKATGLNIDEINNNFSHLSEIEKRLWFQHNLNVKNAGDNTIQIGIVIPPDTPSDNDYLKNNFRNYYMNYITALSNEVKTIEPNASVRVISTLEDEPKIVSVSKKNILIKYGFIGFVMGGILASIILATYRLRGGYGR